MRGAIIAGGEASRFGGKPKGLERVGGSRILDRVVEALEGIDRSPILVANAPDACEWREDLEPIPDTKPGYGTLSGILTAIEVAQEPTMVVAWDMPFLHPGLLASLADGYGSYDAFLPESSGRRGMEPLCAVYTPRCIDPIHRAIERSDYRAISFHVDVDLGTLGIAEVATFGSDTRLFFNVNSPDDLLRAEEMCRDQG